MNTLPKQIPIFPLRGVIFFPETNLPLNIFESRYLKMINDTLKNDKYFGMIQSKEIEGEVYKIGCLGKIDEHKKTEDGRILINLKGINRFQVDQEIKNNELFDDYKYVLKEFDFSRMEISKYCYFGNFAWKPFIILDMLNKSKDNDIILYRDINFNKFPNILNDNDNYIKLIDKIMKNTDIFVPIENYPDNTECTICLDTITSNCTKLDCDNYFHLNCIRNWLLRRNTTCPVCRYDLTSQANQNRNPEITTYDISNNQQDSLPPLQPVNDELSSMPLNSQNLNQISSFFSGFDTSNNIAYSFDIPLYFPPPRNNNS